MPQKPDLPGDRVIVTRWFLRFLGILHLFNFASLAEQVQRCLGSDGLLPVKEYAARLWGDAGLSYFDRVMECPSIFLWLPGDPFLVVGVYLGIALAVMAIAGLFTRFCFAAMFVLYLSYIQVGQVLYTFQWDTLLLETTFLAILMPSSGIFFRNWNRGADKLVTWLVLWLIFRLYIESGLAKLFWGPDTWATLDAMRRYYETAPIPTALGWYANSLPVGWHIFETGAALVIEILCSALVFGGVWSRRFAFVILTGFQLAILLTSNYGVFNYNSLCLHLFLLDDRDLKSIAGFLPVIRHRVRIEPTAPASPRLWIYPVAVMLIALSIMEFMMLAGGRGVQATRLARIQRYTGALHITGKYHLFGPIDPTRYEMVFEVSQDGRTWKEMEFPYKAGDLRRPPPFVAPHHPRVDFRLWFERYPLRWGADLPLPYPEASVCPGPPALPAYVGKLARQLLEEPKLALRHFVNDPLNGEKPSEVRIVFYHYRMTRRGTEMAKTRYWDRDLVGIVYVDPRLGHDGRQWAVPQRTTSMR